MVYWASTSVDTEINSMMHVCLGQTFLISIFGRNNWKVKAPVNKSTTSIQHTDTITSHNILLYFEPQSSHASLVSLNQILAVFFSLLHNASIPGYLCLWTDTAGLQLLTIRANWIVSCLVHLLRHAGDQMSENIKLTLGKESQINPKH